MPDDAIDPDQPVPPDRRRAPAFVVSCILGAVGALLLALGMATGAELLFVGGAAAATLSLGAALYWRSQLIEAWHGPRGGGGEPR